MEGKGKGREREGKKGGKETHQITPIKPQQPIHHPKHFTHHRTPIEPALGGDDGEEVLEDAVEG